MESGPTESLKERAAHLPEGPGCYLYRNARGRVIYVGKAKNLRRRVLSYFQRGACRAPRTVALVAEAADLEVILTGSEVEALILENNLVKKNRPRYNVMLRDDKNFPYLKLTIQDDFPRVVLVRRPAMDGQLYYGPYIPASVARRTLKMVARYFQVATCYERFDGSRQRPCILYQMHQCLAPCVGYVEVPAYAQAVADVRLFLEGRNQDLGHSLRARMSAASVAQDYERAAHYRDLLAAVDTLSRRQAVASVGLEDQDYIGLHLQAGKAALEVFEMRAGLVQSRREFFFEEVQAKGSELMSEAVARYYAGAAAVPRRLFCSPRPSEPDLLSAWLGQQRGQRVAVLEPRRGVHHGFMITVVENARLAWEERFGAGHCFAVAVQEALRQILGLQEAPGRIEGLDISHIQGTDTVASVVVWDGGRPRKSEYRRLRIRSAASGDDYAAMSEAVSRRFGRLVREGRRLPDLVLVDGGRGQLNAACAALDGLGVTTVPVIALAKQHEEIFLPGVEAPLRLPDDSPVRHLVTRIRDEAHRFAVSYHRRRRRQRTLSTVLTEVPGVGARRARALLRAFGSVSGVSAAGEADLRRVVGKSVAAAVRQHLAAGARVGEAR